MEYQPEPVLLIPRTRAESPRTRKAIAGYKTLSPLRTLAVTVAVTRGVVSGVTAVAVGWAGVGVGVMKGALLIRSGVTTCDTESALSVVTVSRSSYRPSGAVVVSQTTRTSDCTGPGVDAVKGIQGTVSGGRLASSLSPRISRK